MDIYGFIVVGIFVGYLIGSIPFALLIGKIFYHKDVRQLGSHNLGATNVARTLGPLAGALVLIFDTIKGGLPGVILYKIAEASLLNSGDPELIYQTHYLSMVYCVTGLTACSGHSHPLFADFKGGKCVSTLMGFILFHNVRVAIIPFILFCIAIAVTKIISVGSLTACISLMICSFIPWCQNSFLFTNGELATKPSLFIYVLSIQAMGLLLIYRHLANIKRLAKGEEKKFSFGSSKKNIEETKKD